MQIITNNVPRFTLDAAELTAAERERFDYHDWAKLDAGEDSATFFRYRGQVYDLAEFMALLSDAMTGWDGACADTFFSGTLVRFTDDPDELIVGRYYE